MKRSHTFGLKWLYKRRVYSLLPLLLLAIIFVFFSFRFAFAGFVSTDGSNFTLDGNPFFYSGTNNYYLGIDPNRSQAEVDEVLNDAKAMGLTVMRTWGFNDGTGGLQTEAGVYNETVFQKLDYAVAKAGELGIKLIIPFVNNWDDYGGMNQYVSWAGAGSHDDFYTNPTCKQFYKNHMSTLLNRVNTVNSLTYKDDPAIMAWELANEPRASSSTDLKNWISEMSAHAKGIDSNHLLTTGVEGQSMADFRNFHKDMAHIDFATMHIYPDYWGMDLNASKQYVDDRIVEATTMLRMPIILEEFGKYRDTSPPIPDSPVPTGGSGNTATRDQFYQGLYDVVREDHGAGSNFWILYHDSYSDYDGMGVYYPADTTTAIIIQTEAQKMDGKNQGYRTIPIFDFGTSTQNWQVGWGELSLSHSGGIGFPSLYSNGSLEVSGLNLDGTESGWVDGGAVRFVPWNWGVMDFSDEGIEKFTVQIFAPAVYGSGLKAGFYIQSPTWDDWNENWFDLTLGEWTEIYLETAGLDMTSLRDFGVHFAVDGTYYNGSVYIDFLATETPVPIPSAILLFGSGLVGLASLGWRREKFYRLMNKLKGGDI